MSFIEQGSVYKESVINCDISPTLSNVTWHKFTNELAKWKYQYGREHLLTEDDFYYIPDGIGAKCQSYRKNSKRITGENKALISSGRKPWGIVCNNTSCKHYRHLANSWRDLKG